MKKWIATGILGLSISLSGCSGCNNIWNNNWAVRASQANMKRDYHIQMYSAGKLVGEWNIQDTVIFPEEKIDGWNFKDANGKLIRISGDVIIYER